MTALAIVSTFTDWLDEGKQLLTRRTETEWALADWLANGRSQFGNQAQFDFLGEQLGIAPKRLKSVAKVAETFPPALRAAGLTFEHHEAVTGLPTDEALAMLTRAERDHMDDRETRVAAVQRRAEIAPSLLPEEDWEQHELTGLTRAWNKARLSVREEFAAMIEEAGMGDLDA